MSRRKNGSPPMWSSCACVSTTPRTFFALSRRYFMSGMTRSMPSISSSGNMSPASTTTMSSPHSIAIMFLPISPTPPSGMTRSGSAKEIELLRVLCHDGLLLLGRALGREQGRQRLEVLLELRTQARLVQRGRGMEHREHRHVGDAARPAVDARDGLAGEELVHREASERHDDRGAQGLDVRAEPDIAGGDLVRERIAVLGRPVPDDVRDEDLVAVEPDPGQKLVEELASGADERFALDVLVVARRLAEEEDPGLGAAVARHRLAGPLVERTTGAGADLGRESLESVGHAAIIGVRVAGGTGKERPCRAAAASRRRRRRSLTARTSRPRPRGSGNRTASGRRV